MLPVPCGTLWRQRNSIVLVSNLYPYLLSYCNRTTKGHYICIHLRGLIIGAGPLWTESSEWCLWLRLVPQLFKTKDLESLEGRRQERGYLNRIWDWVEACGSSKTSGLYLWSQRNMVLMAITVVILMFCCGDNEGSHGFASRLRNSAKDRIPEDQLLVGRVPQNEGSARRKIKPWNFLGEKSHSNP